MSELQISNVTSAPHMPEGWSTPEQSYLPNNNILDIGGMTFRFIFYDTVDASGSLDSTDGLGKNWSLTLKKLFERPKVTTSEIYKNSQQNRDSPVMVGSRSLGTVETKEEPPKPVNGASLDQPVSTMSNTEPTDQIANEVADEIISVVVDKAVSEATSKIAEGRVNDAASDVAGLTISECPSGSIEEQIKTKLTIINQDLGSSNNIEIEIMFNHRSYTLMYDNSTDKLTGKEDLPDALKDEIKDVSIKPMIWEHKKGILVQKIRAIPPEGIPVYTDDAGEAKYEYSLVSSINVSNQDVTSESQESDTIQLTTESGNTYQVSINNPELLRSYSEEEKAAGRTPLTYEQDGKEYMKALCEYHERTKLGLVAEPKFKAQQNIYAEPKIIFFS